MRAMRPLLLPDIVAARQSRRASEDDAPSICPPILSRPRTFSGSTPSPPTSPLTAHRDRSSTLPATAPQTSLSASLPVIGKLFEVAEEDNAEHGAEPNASDEGLASFASLGAMDWQHRPRSSGASTADFGASGAGYDLGGGCCCSLSDDVDFRSRQSSGKRRRSGDATVGGMATRLSNRFPALSGRWSVKKQSTAQTCHSPPTPAPSRSSSLRRQQYAPVEAQDSRLPPSPTASVAELSSEVEGPSVDAASDRLAAEPIDRKTLAPTPLLPPTVADAFASVDAPLQSPLQSPTIAGASSPLMAASPTATPRVGGLPSPPLSTKPSVSSFHRAKPGQSLSTTDIPPFLIADLDDEWAVKLGHANFTIHPEPYMPAACDQDSRRRLFDDWERARHNFTKHQVRTGEHFGLTSNTYKLTQQKWAQIDAQWKKFNDAVTSKAATTGQDPDVQGCVEPAPVLKAPSLGDSKSAGKFPGLGDEDIVGPMVQIASQIQCRPSKRSALLKFLSGINFPGSLLGRSHSVVDEPS